ncbi:hypothetical protein Ddc_07847 [Ditylenchus destructor]|nr:hypothetical protein Ddc_07847 [Ditylenchus destructor]
MCEFGVREKSSPAAQPLRLPFPSPLQEAESAAGKRTMVLAAALRRPPLLWCVFNLFLVHERRAALHHQCTSFPLVDPFIHLFIVERRNDSREEESQIGSLVYSSSIFGCVHGRVNPGDQGSHNKMSAVKLDSFWKWDWEGIAAIRSIQAEDN